MSDDHFTVDGTRIEVWASQKSLQRKDGDADGEIEMNVEPTERAEHRVPPIHHDE